MHHTEYLEKHHAICEQALGGIHLLLSENKPKKALRETEIGIGELDELSEFYKVNSNAHMTKVVLGSGHWKKEGGLYRSWKLGIRNLKEAFDIVQAKGL